MNLPASTRQDELVEPDADADNAPDTAEWPAVVDDRQARVDKLKAAVDEDPDDDGITWIGPGTTAGTPRSGRARARLVLGSLVAVALLGAAGAAMANMVTREHDDPAGTLAVPAPATPDDQPTATGAAAAVPNPATPSATAASPASLVPTTTAPAPPSVPRSTPQPPPVSGSATFEIVTGAASVTLHSRDLGGDLFQVAKSGNAVPKVTDSGSVHRLSMVTGGRSVAAPVDLTLDSGLRWTVRLSGGTSKSVLDFTDGSPAAVELAGGASVTELRLPAPDGTLPILVSKGVSELHVHVAKGVPARLDLRAGGGRVLLDGRTRTGVARGAVLTGAGFDGADNRVDLRAAVGMGTLTVDND